MARASCFLIYYFNEHYLDWYLFAGRSSVLLVTDDPKLVTQIYKITKSGIDVFIPSTKSLGSHSDIFCRLMWKPIIIWLCEKSVKNREFTAFISELVQKRQEHLKRENEVVDAVLRLKAILFGDLKSLPSELKELFPICLPKNILDKKIISLLLRIPEATLQQIQTLLKEADLGKLLYLCIIVNLYNQLICILPEIFSWYVYYLKTLSYVIHILPENFRWYTNYLILEAHCSI